MKVLLARGFVLNAVTYLPDQSGTDIPDFIMKGEDKIPVVAFADWDGTGAAIPLPPEAQVLDEDGHIKAVISAEAAKAAAAQKPVALSEMAKDAPVEKLGGGKVT